MRAFRGTRITRSRRGTAVAAAAALSIAGVAVAPAAMAAPDDAVVTTAVQLVGALDDCAGTEGDPTVVTVGADIDSSSEHVIVGCSARLDLAGAQLTVRDIAIAPAQQLTVLDSGTGGTLTADAREASVPGIGVTDGEFVVESGTVVAFGGFGSAGIGGGNGAAGDPAHAGSIAVYGGDVTASGGERGAGIGGGHLGHGGTVTIEGGIVVADGGTSGAGIGGGFRGNGGDVTVSGGEVDATGGSDGAGIGSGLNDRNDGPRHGGAVLITGGDVSAIGQFFGAGIGGGDYADGADVEITGGTVDARAIGGEIDGTRWGGAAAIGGGYWGAAGPLSIDDATVTAVAEVAGNGIGGGYASPGADVVIGSGAVVTAIGRGARYSAVGGGRFSADALAPFGSLTVAGILRLPEHELLIADSIDDGPEVQILDGGVITGAPETPTVGAQFAGDGQVDNQGIITLATPLVTDGSPAVSVTGHHYVVDFATQDADTADPAPVTVFAPSFSTGERAFPSDPTRATDEFEGWNTQADGSGATVTAASPLPGTDATGTGLRLTLTAQWGDGAPTLSGAPSTTFTVGTAGAYTPTLAGTPDPTVSVSAGTLPGGLELDPGSGAITGTPEPGTGGSYDVTLHATNGVGDDATLDVTITIEEAASITGDADVVFTVGAQGTYLPVLGGYPAPAVAAAGALPAGLTLDASTGAISGIPAAGTEGKHEVTLLASNGVGEDATLTLTLTIGTEVDTFTVELDEPEYRAGEPLVVSGDGLPAGAALTYEVLPRPGVLGTGTVGASGEFEFDGQLPADLPPGTYTLVVTAHLASGDVSVSVEFSVAAVPGGGNDGDDQSDDGDPELSATGGELNLAVVMLAGGLLVAGVLARHSARRRPIR